MENAVSSDSTPEQRKQLFDQVVAIMQMNGIPVNEKTIAYMQPLLDGSMTAAEHQAMLETIIAGIEHD